MILNLTRRWFSDVSTIGELLIGSDFECFTLEDVVREGPKVPGKTAIPEGIYNVIINHSQRFNRDLPLLENVPDFTGVRIHSGNTPDDTEGCILVGTYRGKDFVGHSRDAFNALFGKMQTALAAGEIITIKITNDGGKQG